MTLTRAQRSNLRKLADYLESLPEDYRHFDMWTYFRTDARSVEHAYARKNGGVANCGAVACAVGHGPAAGILFRPSDFNGWNGELNWNSYAARFVGSWECPAYDWCFESYWRDFDNHHWGAAARIRYLLKHGEPPVAFDGDVREGYGGHDYSEFDKRHAKVAA